MRLDDLESMKVPDLKAMAKDLGIDGADAMKKADLIDAISEFELPPAASVAAGGEVSLDPNSSSLGTIEKFAKGSHDNKSYENHPKFHKFKKGNAK